MKAEKTTLASEEAFKMLFYRSPLPMWVFDSETLKFLIVNQAAVMKYGYSEEEFLSMTTVEMRPKEDKNKFLEHYKNIKDENRLSAYQGVWKHKKKNGEILFVEITSSVIVFDGKHAVAVVLSDVTENEKAKQELIDKEENYKSLIEHIPDGILMHTKNGEMLYANPAGLKMIGVSSLETAEEKNFFKYVLPEFQDKIKEKKAEAAEGKEDPFMEIKIHRPDGKIIDVEIKTNHITYLGKPMIEVVLHDVSLQLQLEREQMRFQLEEETNRELKREIAAHIRTRQRLNSNQKYTRLLLDSSIDMICACDQTGKITELNYAAQNTFGYLFSDVLNKDISLLYAEEGQYQRLMKIVSEEGTFLGEVKHIKKNGNTFPAFISVSGLKNEKGEVIGMMSISRDITRIKETEEQLKKSVYEKEILLKEIHHRVKNNMQVISSILKLQSAYVKDKKTIELLDECRNRISSMAFIHATLYMTKDFENINFSEYVNNIAHNLQQSYVSANKKILLRLDVPEMSLHIDDAIPCGLIINELLTNSFKYAFLKKKHGTVGISVKVKKENIILAIWDNGIGFPKKVDYKNTASLGLQLVISLVEQIGGKIKMESINEKGTNFIIAFKKSK